MNQFRPGGFRILPPVIKNLVIINGLFFLAYMTFYQVFQFDLNDFLGLHHVSAEKFSPFQYVTYMFQHGGIGHIFFNMFALWMFGKVLEEVWGPKKFLTYYMITGVGAALIHTLVIHLEISPVITQIDYFLANPNLDELGSFISSHKFRIQDSEMQMAFSAFKNSVNNWQMNPGSATARAKVVEFMIDYRVHFINSPVVVGASGAVFGILLAFGMMFPNSVIYLYFAIPVKAKYFVIAYGLIELYAGFSNNPGDNVAHFAHLGGMIFGIILILYWKKQGKLY